MRKFWYQKNHPAGVNTDFISRLQKKLPKYDMMSITGQTSIPNFVILCNFKLNFGYDSHFISKLGMTDVEFFKLLRVSGFSSVKFFFISCILLYCLSLNSSVPISWIQVFGDSLMIYQWISVKVRHSSSRLQMFFKGLRACIFIKKTPTHVFFCKYCEIFKKSFL